MHTRNRKRSKQKTKRGGNLGLAIGVTLGIGLLAGLAFTRRSKHTKTKPVHTEKPTSKDELRALFGMDDS